MMESLRRSLAIGNGQVYRVASLESIINQDLIVKSASDSEASKCKHGKASEANMFIYDGHVPGSIQDRD